MNTISVCMIVKNEEETLLNILSCAQKFADEIIIVDTGSADKTKEVASKFTDKIFDFVWEDDFSKARNFSFSKATMDYLMWLDADDLILDTDIQKLLDFKTAKQSKVDVFMLKYVAGFDKDFNPTFSYYRERMVKRSSNFVWQDPVHEVIVPRGEIKYLDINIYHNKIKPSEEGRNLRIYKKMIAQGKTLSPRQKFYYARELMFNKRYDEAIVGLKSFLQDKNGWIENKIEACVNLAGCYKAKGEYDNALESLFLSFNYGKPRGNVIYEIGNTYFALNKFEEAIYWYKLALKTKEEDKKGGFISNGVSDFLPSLQLCVCFYKLGDIKRSRRYNAMAKKFRPDDKTVLENEKFFNNLLKK